jgi:hypothetical protein
MGPTVEDVETNFNDMFTELIDIQDPTLIREVLEQVLDEHPEVSSVNDGVHFKGTAAEGISFAESFAKRCSQLLGTPKDFFQAYFMWDELELPEEVPELEDLAKGIRPGRSYLIKEYGKSKLTYELFKLVMEKELPGLCVSRTKPAILESEYGLSPKESKWLTDIYLTEDNLINPTNVAQINIIVKDFIKHQSQGAILLEGIEYLIYYNGNDSIIKLLFSLNENVMVSESILIVPVDPKSIDHKTLYLLEKDLEVIDFT